MPSNLASSFLRTGNFLLLRRSSEDWNFTFHKKEMMFENAENCFAKEAPGLPFFLQLFDKQLSYKLFFCCCRPHTGSCGSMITCRQPKLLNKWALASFFRQKCRFQPLLQPKWACFCPGKNQGMFFPILFVF